MPVVVAVLSAVVALVLLMVLLQTRGSLASTKDALTGAEQKTAASNTLVIAERARVAELDDEVQRLEAGVAEATALVEALEEQHSNDTRLHAELEARVAELEDELVAAGEAREAAVTALAEREGELAAAWASIAEQAEITEANEQVNLTLTHQNEALQVQLMEAADAAARRSAPSVPSVLVSDDGSDLDVPGFSPGMAWDLELVRSERTWRYSVAANPVEDSNPFAATDNPLKLAIEVEALALREDVGAFIDIEWRAGTEIDPTIDPARAHLTLRLAQELLAAAAREMSPSTLIVTSDAARGGISLEVVASDPDDVDFKIPPPPIASEWIGVDEHGGMVVTVKVAD